MAAADGFPLPHGWSKSVRSSVLHAISVAFTALTRAWRSGATSRWCKTRLQDGRRNDCHRPGITAMYPDHIWHVDLTVVPTTAGFWLPWLPFSKLLRWPSCWWVAVVIDQFSRRVTGFALFTRMPTSIEVCEFLDRVAKRAGTKPKYIITDKRRQFFCETFKGWCHKHGVRPRFGAVGKHGSIAVLEGFLRSMKTECTRCILVPFRLDAMRRKLACYMIWYNEHRPHQALDGMTPDEVYDDSIPQPRTVRFEPRPRWPAPAGDRTRPPCLHLIVRYMGGRRHLPVVELTRAA